jgi:hypothetical protein
MTTSPDQPLSVEGRAMTFPMLPVTDQYRKTRATKRGADPFTNDAPYTTYLGKPPVVCPAFMRWRKIVERCRGAWSLRAKPRYEDCSVCPEWYSFMAFRGWLVAHEGWEGLEVDKDILYPGNRLYSPETCALVPQWLNKAFVPPKGSAFGMPPGVTEVRKITCTRYMARCTDTTGTRVFLGLFTNPEDAGAAVSRAHQAKLLRLAETYPDARVALGLYRHALLE